MNGEASLDRVLALLRDLDARAADEPGLRVLVDMTGLHPGTLGTDDVRAIADAWRRLEHLPGGRVAVVAPDDAVFGVNRMTIAFAGAEAFKAVFRSRAEAEEWLTL